MNIEVTRKQITSSCLGVMMWCKKYCNIVFVMVILYDHQVFSWQKVGGISRYFVELIKNLPYGFFNKNSILYSDNAYIDEINLRHFTMPSFKGKERIYEYANRMSSILTITTSKFDIFHPTYYNPYFLKYLKKPYVITVHDMIHEKFVDILKDKKTIKNKKHTIENASKIIAVSENTKKDIMDIYGIDGKRISVVYHGYSFNKKTIVPIRNLPSKYILYVGARKGYKNFFRFLEAFSLINKVHNDIILICTGNRFDDEEQRILSRYGLRDKVQSSYVTDGELAYLYQNALCFVYPSLYEGFGIPILEAFAAKCPLALSNTSCFPEIAKDAGAYFNPYDYSSIAHTILNIIENKEYRSNLIQKGTSIVSNYSWAETGYQTARIYGALQ